MTSYCNRNASDNGEHLVLILINIFEELFASHGVSVSILGVSISRKYLRHIQILQGSAPVTHYLERFKCKKVEMCLILENCDLCSGKEPE